MAGFLLILNYHFSSFNLVIVKEETKSLFIKNTVKVFIRTAEAFVIQINHFLSHCGVCLFLAHYCALGLALKLSEIFSKKNPQQIPSMLVIHFDMG